MIQTKQASIRSLEENAYYHGVIVQDVAEYKHWGVSKAHLWIKNMWDVDSTALLTTVEFEELMENVRMYCLLHWDLEIPLPNK